MIGKILLKIQDYISIVAILIHHLKQKWRDQQTEFITFNLVILTGITLSIISTKVYGHPEDFIELSLFYIGTILVSLFIISIRQKKLVIHRIIYEIRYVYRMITFMIGCYQNIMKQYLGMAKTLRQYNESVFEFYDMIVVSTVFKKLFIMYFDTIDAKNKNPEPYLIDVKEMTDIYTSKEFNDFYSMIFLNMKKENGQNSYERVIIKILDEVMSQLYTKSWFVSYYDDKMVETLIKYVLDKWYDSVAKFESNQPIVAI